MKNPLSDIKTLSFKSHWHELKFNFHDIHALKEKNKIKKSKERKKERDQFIHLNSNVNFLVNLLKSRTY